MGYPTRQSEEDKKSAAPSEEKPRRDNRMLEVADACFEMFSIRELRTPEPILPELKATFPDVSPADLSSAVSLALSWKRLLRRAGKTLH